MSVNSCNVIVFCICMFRNKQDLFEATCSIIVPRLCTYHTILEVCSSDEHTSSLAPYTIKRFTPVFINAPMLIRLYVTFNPFTPFLLFVKEVRSLALEWNSNIYHLDRPLACLRFVKEVRKLSLEWSRN
jgi:hypothetical protein